MRLDLATDLLLCLLDGADEIRRLVGVRRSEREASDELLPILTGRLAHASRLDGVVCALAELLVGERARAPGDADHAVLLGHEPCAVEVEEPGQQLALGEVACRPEQHDHVVLRPRTARAHATASAVFAARPR